MKSYRYSKPANAIRIFPSKHRRRTVVGSAKAIRSLCGAWHRADRVTGAIDRSLLRFAPSVSVPRKALKKRCQER